MCDDDYIRLSELLDWTFCKRRFYLRNIECVNGETEDTIEGRLQHKTADSERIEKRKGYIRIYGMNVYSRELRLVGRCDLVELYKDSSGSFIKDFNDTYIVNVVEYKHGKMHNNIEYNVQLCGQVLCIEEMFNLKIEQAEILYKASNERVVIKMNEDLRNKTLQTIEDIRRYL